MMKMSRRTWIKVFVLCTIAALTAGQYPTIFGGRTHNYDDDVFLGCIVFGSTLSYTFTWMVPVTSSSLERGTIDNTSDLSTLTFEARKEDSGIYTCFIHDGTQNLEPLTQEITVGNVLLTYVYNVCNV